MAGFKITYDKEKHNNKVLESLKVLLFDHTTYSVFQQNSNSIFGDSITYTLGSQNIEYFKVRFKQEIHLEDDFRYPCIDYKARIDILK